MKINTSYMFICLLFLIGCSRSPYKGVFIEQVDSTNYFELKDNNSFFFSKNGNNVVGKYEIDSKVLTLAFEDGHAKRYEMKEKTFIDEQGMPWVLWNGGETGLAYEKLVRIQMVKLKNRNDIINVLNLLGSNAFAYKERPAYYAGGNNSYLGYTIPFGSRLMENPIAKYDCLIKSDSIQFIATSLSNSENEIWVTLNKKGQLCNWQYFGEFK